MKKISLLFIITLFFALFIYTGCNKQDDVSVFSNNEEINLLADKAIAGFGLEEIYSGSTDEGIYMKYEGIPPDFLVEENDLEGTDSVRQYIRAHSFIKCLQKLDLTQTQKSEIKSSICDYRNCKADAMKRAKALYNHLHEKYKAKCNRIYTAFLNGTISKEEYIALVEKLKSAFREELKNLHLREKLNEAFKQCFRVLLKDFQSILTESQWYEFAECYKNG